ncbi:glycosyltransferase family 9 protein [bacterium]|nr:glycosyltransferase family 9 protein [candidate division CSSED10-310 bacterium]
MVNRILLVKTHAIGDVLMTTPALRAVRIRFPDAEISYLVGSWSAEILRNNPNIDSLLVAPDEIFFKKRILRLLALRNTIKSRSYDLAVLFQPAFFVRALIRSSGVRKIAGFHNGKIPKSLDYACQWRANRERYVGEDFLDVARCLGAENDGQGMEYHIPISAEKSVKKIFELQRIKADNYIVISPGGGKNPRDHVLQKIWPGNRYANIAVKLCDLGYSVLVTGLEGEWKVDLSFSNGSNIVDLTGKTTLAELAELINNAKLLITNDSLPMHLGIALKTKTIPIFGPTRPEALLPEGALVYPVVSSSSCAPCYDNEVFRGCPYFHCIQSISEDEVAVRINKALGSSI